MKLIILGPQGSGKGTQAKLISEKMSIPHISTGDIFRENIRDETELGKNAEQFINKGMLIPGELTIMIVHERISRDDCRDGFILDGFPRTLEQAKALEKITGLDKAIDIEISDEIAVKRISSRRTCEKCGAIYSSLNDDVSKGCQKCNGRLITRDDDTPDAVRERLKIYHENTKPLIDFYKKKGILLEIAGDKAINKIFDEIMEKL